MCHTRALRRGEHALGLRGVEGERFLAQDVPAGFTRLDCKRCVRVGRRGDGDRVDPFERERIGERRARPGYPESISAALRARPVAADEPLNGEPGIAQRGDVHPAPEPGTDDDRARH